MIVRLIDCSDYEVNYGFIVLHNVSVKEMQDKIDEIKGKFFHEDNYGWCIDDVLAELPAEWEWEYHTGDEYILI